MARRPRAIPKLGREAPVFYPTMEDMKRPFEEYVSSIEEEAWQYGIAILQPPPGWSARPSGYRTLEDWLIQRPIRQYVTGSKGVFRSVHVEEKSMQLAHFRRLANTETNRKPSIARSDDQEYRLAESGVESQQQRCSDSCSGGHSSRVAGKCFKGSSSRENAEAAAIECGAASGLGVTEGLGKAGLDVHRTGNRALECAMSSGIGNSKGMLAIARSVSDVPVDLKVGDLMAANGNIGVTEPGDRRGQGATGRLTQGGVTTADGSSPIELDAWWLCKEGGDEVDMALVERSFWKNVTHSPPLYGADGVGSFFDASVKVKELEEAERQR